MSYVSPAIQNKLETLPINLKNEILSRGVNLNNLQDLISVLETIANEEEK